MKIHFDAIWSKWGEEKGRIIVECRSPPIGRTRDDAEQAEKEEPSGNGEEDNLVRRKESTIRCIIEGPLPVTAIMMIRDSDYGRNRYHEQYCRKTNF